MSTPAISFANVALYIFLVATQILGAALLPRTDGFSNPQWTLICLAVFAVSLWSFAYIIHTGIPLSVIIPILAALVPLASIAVGVVFYKEPASLLKITLLCSACGVIGLASTVK